MGLIVDPFASNRQEITLPEIEVPRHLQEDLAANLHLEPLFYKAVQQALDRSLNDPETALHNITVQAIKERIELCYNTVLILRMELNYPLRKCFDLLPAYFRRALMEGRRPEDMIAAAAPGTAWAKDPDAPGREAEVSTEDENTEEALKELREEGLQQRQVELVDLRTQ